MHMIRLLLLLLFATASCNAIGGGADTVMEEMRKIIYEDNTEQVFRGEDYEDNVCQVDSEVYNITLLKGCVEIISPLVLGEHAYGHLEPTMIYVEGCIQIVNTDLFDVIFLSKLEQVDCPIFGGNKISQNDYMCIDKPLQEKIKKFFPQLESEHSYCPSCANETMSESCQTYIGDFQINSTASVRNLREIVGTLFIDRVYDHTLMEKNDSMYITCKDCTEYIPVIIVNSVVPPNSFFDFIQIAHTSAQHAISIYITGYKMPRGLYAMLTHRTKKPVDVQFEDEGECYISNHTWNPFTEQDLMECEVLYEYIRFNSSNAQNLNAKWKKIVTTQPNITFIGGSELVTLFHRNVELNYTHYNFKLFFQFTKDVCMITPVINLARRWFSIEKADESEQHRVFEIQDPDCHIYEGVINDYDLRRDNGTKMHTVNGALHLKVLSSDAQKVRSQDEKKAPKKERKLWFTNISRFENLTIIRKPLSVKSSVPALILDMCGNFILPRWLKTVKIESEREDDILIRIGGPGYKMPKAEYDALVAKYGENRLDIEPLRPGECIFNGPVKNLSLLDECEVVIGDLIFDNTTTGKTNGIVKKVTGCIKITNTTLSDIYFLRFEIPYDHEACNYCVDNGFLVKDNPKLCVSHSSFGPKTKKSLVVNNNSTCGNSLGPDEHRDKNIVIQDIEDETEIAHFSSLKEMYGRIVIRNTKLKKLEVFKNLTTIVYHGHGPAILLENNPNLTSFKCPSLKIVIAAESPFIVFKGNPELDISENEQVFKKATGEDNLYIEEEIKKEIDEEQREMLIGIGIGAASAFGVLLLVAGITVAAFVIPKKIKEKKKNKTKELKDEDAVTAKSIRGVVPNSPKTMTPNSVMPISKANESGNSKMNGSKYTPVSSVQPLQEKE